MVPSAGFERRVFGTLESFQAKYPRNHIDVFDEAEFVELAVRLRSGEVWPTWHWVELTLDNY